MIGIVDYGVGNLYSLTSSLRALGQACAVSADRDELERCDRLILPGVGAFGDAMAKLRVGGMDAFVIDQARQGKPLMGICLGMQMLFDESREHGRHKGLGLIGGSVEALANDLPSGYKVPHMGWNALRKRRQDPLSDAVADGAYVYFVHSFYAKHCDAACIADCEYGIPVTAAVRQNNVMGTQFHPEKSGEDGLRILQAFATTQWGRV